MKISKKYLQKIIKEEFNKILISEEPERDAGEDYFMHRDYTGEDGFPADEFTDPDGPTRVKAIADTARRECPDLEWPTRGPRSRGAGVGYGLSDPDNYKSKEEFWNEVPQQGTPGYNEAVQEMAKQLAFANSLEVLKKFLRVYPVCYEAEHGASWDSIAGAEWERFDDILDSAIKNWNSWHSSAGATVPANENRITVKSLTRLIEQQLDRIL